MTPKPSLDQLNQLLDKTALFTRLGANIKQRLVQTARWPEVQAGEVVVLEGEQMPGLYVLHGTAYVLWAAAVIPNAVNLWQIASSGLSRLEEDVIVKGVMAD